MAAAALPAGRPAEKSPTSVDKSLWWEPFESLLAELERADPASSPASSLVDKLDRHGAWLLKSVTLFKSPNQASRSALEGGVVGLGARRMEVRPELKELALELSRIALLDEVQSYIVVSRYVERNNMPLEFKVENLRHRVLLHYYLERQCLLKCIRQIIVHSYGFDSNAKISKMVKKLFSDGLEKVLLCIMEDLFSCNHFGYADADFTTLSVEESLIETNLVLDILFLAYYDTISTCNYEQWKSLCSIFKGILSNSLRIGKLSVSREADNFLRQAKTQLLLILIETLNLDNLLHLVHDELPFRQDEYVFSVVDIQEIDANLASFNISETPEVGVLFLAWGVFHCLLSSLPDKHDNNILAEIDHVAYVRQAFEVSPLTYLKEILDRNVLGDSVCSHMGYKSVMKTLISAFIAAYEISNQHESSTSDQLLDVLCKIYRGEELLCMQFWDKESFVDSPIRCFLSSLEGEFPFRSVELVCFLSALCEGAWAAECVYNFLDRMCGLTSLFKIPGLSSAEDCPKIIETSRPYAFPGFDVLIIPSQTRGQVLKIMDGNTALVRWQHKQSGIYILLLTLVWDLHRSHYEEVSVILDLLHRLMSMNMALCFALLNSNYSVDAMPRFAQNIPCFDFASIVCFVISNVAVGDSNVGLMSTCFSILSKLLQCSPIYIAEVAQRTHILDLGAGVTSSGVWMPPGRLAKFLMIDCEQTEDCCSLTLSVLSFIGQLVEAGVEDDMTHSLVVFSLQYVLIDHEHWKFKVRHARWKVTLKALELMKTCIDVIQDLKRLGLFVRDVLLLDSSIHDALFRIMCVTAPSLEEFYVSRQFEWKEIEGVQLAIVSVLDIIYSMLSKLKGSNSLLFSQDYTTDLSAFHQALVSATTKPIPILKAVMSLISFARNPDIQIGAARVLSMLCSISENIFLITDEALIAELRPSIHKILCDDTISNEDLLIAVFQMLTSAAIYQPLFLLAIFSVDAANTYDVKQLRLESTSDSSKTAENSLLNLLMERVRMSNALIQSSPLLLLNILFLLRALWRGTSHYACILKSFKASTNFWGSMLSILEKGSSKSGSFQKLKGNWSICLAYEYQCQAAVLDIVAHEFFLHKKMLQEKETEAITTPLSEKNIVNNSDIVKGKSNCFLEMDVQLSSWIGGSGIEELTKLYTYCEYDEAVFDHLKASICMFIVKLMQKLSEGDVGCMSVSLVEDVRDAFKKLNEQPAFAELLLQYSFRGYSKGKESSLILTDLYYHLQGELEGRVIAPGSFKDLSTFLLCLDIFKKNVHTSIMEFLPPDGTSYLFDSKYVRRRINLKCWEHSKLETSKEAMGNMLMHISNANNMVFCMDSKQSALKALNSVLSVSLVSMGPVSLGQVMKEKVAKSCTNLLLKTLSAASELLISPLDFLDNVLNYLNAQTELLLVFASYLSRCGSSQPSKHQYVPIFVDAIKASGSVIRVLDDVKPCTPELKETIKLLLSLLLTSFDYCLKSDMQTKSELVGANALSDISFASLGILPTLCCLAEAVEYCNIAISTMDVILKDFLNSSTWLPVLQKHLNLQNAISKLQDKNPLISVFVLLKFFLTLARTHGGAELLHSVNILPSLKYLFAHLLAEKPSLESGLISMTGSDGKAESIWGLGLAIVIAMIDSLADCPSSADVVENVIMFFFVEKSDLISYYLSAPELPADDQSKKRARTKNASTSLHALMETKSTLELICTLAKHQIVWNKTVKGRDSALREQIIHLLAFISKGGQRIGESPSKTPSIMWFAVSKEQLDSHGGLQLMGSKHGWFALSALDGKLTSFSPGAGTALVEANQIREPIQASSKIHFSDSVALLMYKIAYFLITFLCSQAEAAAKRAEDVGFIDLAHYPELPMPEILHGLQDQCMAIVTEVCLFNEKKVVLAESQAVCLFLLQIVEKALYLELCVCQICGIRPVLGRVEDFSKRIKSLFKAAEQHTFLVTPLKTLRPIFPHLYPGLLLNEAPST